MGFTALIEDLEQRGLLRETLVIAIGEFGRTPKINGAGGRDHWGHVFSFALAGAGICAGQVYGSSDRDGAYPARDAVTAGDLTATLFHSLGIDHESSFRDAEGRERRLTLGSPIRALLGGGVATADRIPPGGSVLAAGFDTSLLLNMDFSQPVPLSPVDRGSRPKGWRAAPLPGSDDPAFGVRLVPQSAAKNRSQTQHIIFGVGRGESAAVSRIARGDRAILAQEMRNPRAGRFTFTVEACIVGPTREACELFQKHCACRLVIYRFAAPDKNPLNRQELGSIVVQPPIVVGNEAVYAKFEFVRILDSAAPGQNFSIGRGLGVSIEVEKTSDGTLTTEGFSAALHVGAARLTFASRTINDKVVV